MKAITYKEKKRRIRKDISRISSSTNEITIFKGKKLLPKYSNGYPTRKKKLLSR